MDWLYRIAVYAARVPIERILLPPPDPAKALEKFATALGSATTAKEAPVAEKPTIITQKPATSPDQTAKEPEKRATKLDEELFTLYFLQKNLQGLEVHLPTHCQTNNRSCDCCDKHSADVSLYAGENLRFTDPGEKEFYTRVHDWGDLLNSKRPDEGKMTDAEYKRFADEAYEFRKRVQERRRQLRELAGPAPELTLEAAKKVATEAAISEVERQYKKEAQHGTH